MRKLYTALMICLFSIPCYAASYTSPAIDLGVSVPKMCSMDMDIVEVPADSINPWGDGNQLAPGSEMDFGELVWSDDLGIWLAQKYFAIYLYPKTSGDKYSIKQTCYGFKSGSKDFTKSLTMTPQHWEQDHYAGQPAQGPLQPGESVGTASLAVGSDIPVYTSNTGRARIIRCDYGIYCADPGAKDAGVLKTQGAKVVTGEQQAGPYSGVITFTLVTM